jgi:hypothetical protein
MVQHGEHVWEWICMDGGDENIVYGWELLIGIDENEWGNHGADGSR